jgi:hypothetical protein
MSLSSPPTTKWYRKHHFLLSSSIRLIRFVGTHTFSIELSAYTPATPKETIHTPLHLDHDQAMKRSSRQNALQDHSTETGRRRESKHQDGVGCVEDDDLAVDRNIIRQGSCVFSLLAS